MRFDLITVFPEMFTALSEFGVCGRAIKKGGVSLKTWQLRDFASNAYRTIDDRPYGGGPGMIMTPEPLKKALDAIHHDSASSTKPYVVYLSPQGKTLDHHMVMSLKNQPQLVLLSGRYEGVDERFIEQYVDCEISIGDYVLSGGELPAMVLMDAIIRQLPGVLHDDLSAQQDSFVDGLLDCPHYTRPDEFQGMAVPAVLQSGNHALIERWRLQQKLGRTWLRRPDLLAKRELNKLELRLLNEFKQSWHAKLEQEQSSIKTE